MIKKFKMYRIIGKDYNCVYVPALSSESISSIITRIEERDGRKIDRLEYVYSFSG